MASEIQEHRVGLVTETLQERMQRFDINWPVEVDDSENNKNIQAAAAAPNGHGDHVTVPTAASADGDPGTVPTAASADGAPGTVPTAASADGAPGTGSKISTIIALVGVRGIGKTHMARDICQAAIKDGLCYETLWISVGDGYNEEKMPVRAKAGTGTGTGTDSSAVAESEGEGFKTKTGLLEDAIERQILCLSSTAEEWEVENNVKKEEDQKTIDQMVQIKLEARRNAAPQTSPKEKKKLPVDKKNKEDGLSLFQIVQSKLSGKRKDAEGNGKRDAQGKLKQPVKNNENEEKEKKKKKYDLLLVLDECRNKTTDHDLWRKIWFNVRALLPSIKDDQLLTVITRRKLQKTDSITKKIPGISGKETEVILPTLKQIELRPLSQIESRRLLLDTIQVSNWDIEEYSGFLDEIVEMSKGLPAVITMIAALLEYSNNWRIDIEKAAKYLAATKHVNPLIHCAYTMLPTDVLKFCFCHSVQYFSKYSGIHYIELITQWILEGYFDSFEHIKRKYQEGHAVLMELINRRMLKIQEDNNVVAEGAALFMIGHIPGFLGTSQLGLAGVVSEQSQRLTLGRITQIDGMIKTICDPTKWDEVSTLLIDGSRLRLEVDAMFFARMKKLDALTIFNSGLKSLNLSTSDLEKQSAASLEPEPEKPRQQKTRRKLLVLRSCDMLNSITHFEELKTLSVLEISGAASVEKIGDMFEGMAQLQTLNLSGCQMKLLPSLSKLTKLRFLILRGCSLLQKLPRINDLQDLELIDLCGATSLTFFPEQDLSRHPNLQMIDLSHTQVKRLPKFGHLQKLARISIEGCKNVRIFPSLQNLGGLKILYLSGIEFRNFHQIRPRDPRPRDPTTESKPEPKPLFPASLTELHLKDCHILKFLPPIEGLINLEVLDVSGVSNSEFEIKDNSFHNLDYLRELNLSNTKLRSLPSLTNLRSLRKLSVKNCELLEEVPKLEGLKYLEEIDFSGCSSLVKYPNLEDISELKKLFPKLKKLNLSYTGIKQSSTEITATSSNVKPDEKHPQQYGTFNLTESKVKGKLPLILVNDGEILHPDNGIGAQSGEISASTSAKKHPNLYGVFTPAEGQATSKLVVNDGENFQLLEKNHVFKEVCKEKILIPLPPQNGETTEGVLSRDFYFRAAISKNGDRFLEICRLESISDSLKEILNDTEYISWMGHRHMKSLSDLDAGSSVKMKGCRIVGCIVMENVFSIEKDMELGQKLESLWLSSLPKMDRLFSQKLETEKRLDNLKHLYLDCCLKLRYVFTSSDQIPKNLEVLEIKFCDRLETIYKQSKDEQDENPLPELKKLILLALPALTKIGFTMPEDHQINECPKLPSSSSST